MDNKITKSIVDDLIENGSLNYGSVIPEEEFRTLLNISPLTEENIESMSLAEIRKQIENDDLAMVNLVHKIINPKLHKLGRHIKKEKANYRVLLPSENSEQIDKYMTEASNKMKKAKMLLKHTPSEFLEVDNRQARLLLSKKFEKNTLLSH